MTDYKKAGWLFCWGMVSLGLLLEILMNFLLIYIDSGRLAGIGRADDVCLELHCLCLYVAASAGAAFQAGKTFPLGDCAAGRAGWRHVCRIHTGKLYRHDGLRRNLCRVIGIFSCVAGANCAAPNPIRRRVMFQAALIAR